MLLDGVAGIGKTSLLAEAGARAEARGVVVLRSCGEQLGGGSPWALAQQLVTPVIARPDADELLVGAARLCRPLLDATPTDRETDAFPLVHGLHWLTVNLSQRAPVLLVLDDVHWADAESLRFAAYLLRRLDGLAASMLLATRPGEAADDAAAAAIAADPATDVRPVEPLDDGAIHTLIHAELPTASAAFRDALTAAVAGNPFLCKEVARAIRADGIDPGDDAARRLPDLRLVGIRSSVLVRLGRIGGAAPDVVAAAAVLGPAASIDCVSELVPHDELEVTAAIDSLAAAGLLTVVDDTLAFAHPIVREVVHADLGPARSRQAHAAAARALTARGSPATVVAAHLLRAGPVRDDWAIDTLRCAAAAHLHRGAPAEAAHLLRAARDGPAAPPVRAEVLLELGRAEAAAGGPAVEHLRQALAQLPATSVDPELTVQLGEALYASGHFTEAAEAFEQGLGLVGGVSDVERRAVVEAQLLAGLAMAGTLAGLRPHRVRARIATVVAGPLTAPSLAERILLAVAAGEQALGVDAGGDGGAGSTREQVMQLVDRARPDHVLQDHLATVSLEPLTLALVICDELDRARGIIDEALDRARARGELASFATLLPVRGLCMLGRGALSDAVSDASDALRVADDAPAASRQTLAAVRHVLARASLARGEPDDAARALDVPDAAAQWGDTPLHGWYLDAVGRLELARGRPEAALGAFRAAGERFCGAGGPGAYCDWRTGAARAARALGAIDEAADHAAEADRLATSFGAPRAMADALRARAGLAGDPETAIDLLEQAVALVEPSEAVLDRARARVDLGAALRRAGRRRDARPHLRHGIEEARHCGARPLAERAATELAATGARRPTLALTGVDALTPSERRVAQMAGQGLANREIAEALFVTRKTVEVHLTSAYRKLGISSRADLPVELTP